MLDAACDVIQRYSVAENLQVSPTALSIVCAKTSGFDPMTGSQRGFHYWTLFNIRKILPKKKKKTLLIAEIYEADMF